MQTGDKTTAEILNSQSGFFETFVQYDEDGNEIGIVPVFEATEINFTVDTHDYVREEIPFTEIERIKEKALEEKPSQPSEASLDTCSTLHLRFFDNGRCEIVSETERSTTEVLTEIKGDAMRGVMLGSTVSTERPGGNFRFTVDDLREKEIITIPTESDTPYVYTPSATDLKLCRDTFPTENIKGGNGLERTFTECVEDCMGVLHVTPKSVASTECFLCSYETRHKDNLNPLDVYALQTILGLYGAMNNVDIALQLHRYYKENIYTVDCGMPKLTKKIALEHIERHSVSTMGHSAVQVRK